MEPRIEALKIFDMYVSGKSKEQICQELKITKRKFWDRMEMVRAPRQKRNHNIKL